MTREEVKNLILTAVDDIQEASGEPVPDLDNSSVLIGDVEGFDSLRGLELSVALSRHFQIGDDINVCITDEGKAANVRQLVDRLMSFDEVPTEED